MNCVLNGQVLATCLHGQGKRKRSHGLGHPERSRTAEGRPPDWTIRGQQAHSPGSAGAENEGVVHKMPTPELLSAAQGCTCSTT